MAKETYEFWIFGCPGQVGVVPVEKEPDWELGMELPGAIPDLMDKVVAKLRIELEGDLLPSNDDNADIDWMTALDMAGSYFVEEAV